MDDDTAANLFAKFFNLIYSKDDGNEPFILTINNFQNDDIAFNCDTIKIILKQLPNKFSSGPDAIPTSMLKRFSDELCLPIALILQKSLNQKKLPNEWKRANFIPVYKGKRNRHKVINYRPISLTSTIYVQSYENLHIRYINYTL